MASYPRVRDQHIAVFGESGSGKTVLLSSFFGPTQEGSYANELWDVIADDTGQGNHLYQNFLGMRDSSTTPLANRFSATTYYFTVKLKGEHTDSAKKRPFDALRLAWHDYPGEWFEQSPSSAEEATRRIDTFRSLLKSDVALILVDGQKLKDFEGQEEQYLKSLLTNFRQGLLRLKDDLVTEDGRLVEFPRIWLLALSKADLFPQWDVDTFRDLIIRKTAPDVEKLRETLAEFIESPEALSMGDDFMLLSSAKFEPSPLDSDTPHIDVTQRVGLDLVLPVASMLPLERRVQWSEQWNIPRKVLDSLADGAESLAGVLTGKTTSRLLDKVPRVGKVAKAAIPVIAEAVRIAGPKLKEANEKAREKNDFLRATLTQFKLDLEQGRDDKLIRTRK